MTINNNFRCTDLRIENLCVELLDFLKSEDKTRVIHTKEITKTIRETIQYCDITIGFISIRMIFKPYQRLDNMENGSNEGASIILSLPFSESGSMIDEKISLKGYFSTRGKEAQLTIIAPDSTKPVPFGTKRIVNDKAISEFNPLSLPHFD